MVETSHAPELKLRPEFRSDAEVKFMATLSKSKKITGVKSGKIPLVSTTGVPQCTKSWPAGNPTDTKFMRDEEFYEFAEDEPFYASKEVERLEDTISTKESGSAPKSDIIERITESRHQRHKESVEDLHEELGILNKAVDPQIADVLDTSKDQIEWVIAEIQILFSGIEQDHVLYTYPLKRLEVLWDDVVSHLQKRATIIDDLNTTLNKTEHERGVRISDIFKRYNALFHEIAYLSTEAINMLMDREVYSSNLLLLANYKYYTKVIAQVKIENVVILRENRVRWEERVATWRDLHINETKSKFDNFMNTSAITDCIDIKQITSLMLKELECLSERRQSKVRTITKLKPPSVTQKTVLKWYEEVCEISLTLENTNSKYLLRLASVGEAVVNDCEGVADKMLCVLKEEGVCSNEEAEELKTAELMAFISTWNDNNKDKMAALEHRFMDDAATFNANLHILYEFQSKAAQIWTLYDQAVQSQNNELLGMMKTCRSKHDEINQTLESTLDMNMDRMRQDTHELDLQKNLEVSTEALKDIAAAYDSFQTDLDDVIRMYPEMVAVELEDYYQKIRLHLGCEVPSDETETTEQQPGKEVFLTEVKVPDSKQSTYSDTKFEDLQRSLVVIYMEHLNNLKAEVLAESEHNVEERLAELKSEVELRHHIHAPRAMRMKLDIYNVRLNELKNHFERVKQHAAGIALEISNLRNQFKQLGAEHSVRGKEFKELVEGCENTLPSQEKTAHLTSLQNKVSAAYEEHMNNIKFELSSFRSKMEEKLNDLRESNQHFGLAFKPFAEGGNFGPEEIDKYRKKLEKCNSKIDNCETFVLVELDGMESKCLDAAVDVTHSFENKLKMHLLDVAFLEKINSWMSNCQVRIKTEVAACNMMSKNLKTNIEMLRKLIDSCARPHPDKPTVRSDDVLSAIPAIYNRFQERINYLDCAKSAQQTTIKITTEQKEPTSPGVPPLYSAVNLSKNILKLSRRKSDLTVDAESLDKKKSVGVVYDWFILKEDKERVVPQKRGKSRGDTTERTRRFGSASSRSSMMSVVLKDVQSFMPMIKKILQETQGALFLSSEAYYTQYQGPPVSSDIAESLEACMEGLNKRLNNYYVQSEEYYNKCIQELRSLLSNVLELHVEVPGLLFNDILERFVTEVSQTVSTVKLQFERNRVKIENMKEANKVQLKPILGHPNNEVDLNNLCRHEEDRALTSRDILNEFLNEMKNTETAHAKQFVDSVNNCLEGLLNLFDQLVTIDDVTKGKETEKKLSASVLLKKEQRVRSGVDVMVDDLSKSGQQIKLLNLVDISERPISGSSSKSDYVHTSKFTPVHQETIVSKDKVMEEYRGRYKRIMDELEGISYRWRTSEEKWKRQWTSSVQSVRNLYKPV